MLKAPSANRRRNLLLVLGDYRHTLVLAALGLYLALSIATFREDTSVFAWGFLVEKAGDNELLVTWVQPASMAWDGGLRPGDRITAIKNQQVDNNRDTIQPLEIEHLTPIRFTSANDNRVQELAWPANGKELDLTISLWFVGVVFVISGSLVIIRSARTEAAIAFFLFCLVAGANFAIASTSYSGVRWVIPVRFALTNFFGACFAYFFLVFPEKRRLKLGSLNLLPYAVFLPPTISLIYYLVATRWDPHLYENGRIILSLLSVTAMIVVGIIAIVVNYLRSSFVETRYELRLLGAGTALSFVPLLVLVIIPGAIGPGYLVSPPLGVIPVVLIPLTFGYAIMHYQWLGEGTMIHRRIVSIVVWVLLVSSLASLYLVLDQYKSRTASGDHQVFSFLQAVTIAMVALFLGRVQSTLMAFVDRVFFRDVYDYARTVQDLTTELAAIRNATEMTRYAAKRLAELMNLSFALILVRRGDGKPSVIASSAGLADATQEEIRACCEAQGTLDKPEASWLRVEYCEDILCWPLLSGSVTTGLFLLGPKATNSGFRKSDFALLQTVAGQVSLGLNNVQLLQATEEHVLQLEAYSAELSERRRQLTTLNQRLIRAQEEERAKFAADIHDQPLQTILQLQRQLGNCPSIDSQNPCHSRKLAENVAAELRQVCANLRPSILDDLGLVSALEWLVAEANKLGTLTASFINQDRVDQRLPSEVEVTFYRVAQEAINNCLRHAGAANLVVRLLRTETEISLTVFDDGCGFTPPVRNADLLAGGHMGLIGMQERMSLIGGQLEVVSRIDQGAEVRARMTLGKVDDEEVTRAQG